jgi:hypothetical protein
MTHGNPSQEQPDADPRREFMRLAFSYLILAVIVVAASLVAILLLYYVLSIEYQRNRLLDFIYSQPAALMGIPAAIGFAIFIVLILRTTEGPIEFELIGVKFRGASGQIVMWIFTFLSIIAAIKLLWI